ncbi:MAG: glycosyltransferase [Planctomycetaceae bacterium]
MNNPTSSPQISILVIAHRESLLIHRTLRSVHVAVENAQQHDIPCEILLILDRGDERTRGYIQRFPAGKQRVIEVNYGDPALAREEGRRQARGKYIALIDGDDLYGENWLTTCYQYAEKSSVPKLVLHAEHQVVFEAESFLVSYQSSSDSDFNPIHMAGTNYWTSILFFSRTIFQGQPFSPIIRDSKSRLHQGYGFEDWHWLTEQLAFGAEVHAVPGTCNFVRRKHSVARSILQADAGRKTLLPPSSLFSPVPIAEDLRKQADVSPTPAIAFPRPPRLVRLANKIQRAFQKYLPKTAALASKVKREVARGCQKVFPKLQKAFQRSSNSTASIQTLPEVAHLCRQAHLIEPKIFPTEALFAKRATFTKAAPWYGNKYARLCKPLQKKPTHVLLVPWLKRGGSDLETINYVEALCDASPDNYPIVIGTLNTDSPWAKRLPAGVPFINFGEIAFDASPEDQKRLLGTFLVQLGAPIIHNMNSELGYILFRDHGPALLNQSQLYASVFCEDITHDGRIVGYAFNEIVDCFDYLSCIFSDNQRILNYLQDLFGFPSERLHLHYQPIAEQPALPAKSNAKLHILWAGRMDQQKRPDLLYQVVKQLQGEPIHFSIYGGSVVNSKIPTLDWSKLSNCTYYGPYDGFESLPLEKFDLLLHTAQWEGLPNVLLEALVRGLPVVASAVGGVPELIQTGKTGIAVAPFDDVAGYCQALTSLQRDRQKLAQLAAQGRDLVLDRHGWEAFHQTLRQTPDYYLPRSCEVSQPPAASPLKVA